MERPAHHCDTSFAPDEQVADSRRSENQGTTKLGKAGLYASFQQPSTTFLSLYGFLLISESAQRQKSRLCCSENVSRADGMSRSASSRDPRFACCSDLLKSQDIFDGRNSWNGPPSFFT